MLHVSTRGEAPALGFADALLTGLARDGGLYLPEAWPSLTARHDPRLCRASPMREVAKAVLGPLVDGDIPEADLGRMIDEAYASFRHPAVCPLTQIGDNLFVLELFHGPTLAFKDVAMQLLGPADGPRAEGPRRPRHHRRRDLGRYGQRRGRGVQGPRSGRHLHPLPAWPRLGRAAPADDDGRLAQRPCARGRGHLRRLPDHGEGHVQPCPLPRRAAALRRELHQLGPRGRAGRLLLHRRRRPGLPPPSGLLLGADRQFRRHPRRLGRQAHGPADRAADDRHQRQRHPGPHARLGHLRDQGRRSPPPRPPWTSRSRPISSGCCSRPMAATARRSAASWRASTSRAPS